VDTGQSVIVADRYAHDVLLSEPGPLRRALAWFESEPFAGFVLNGQPEVIADRSEYDEQSVALMYDRLQDLDFERLDAINPPQAVVSRILEAFDGTEVLLRGSDYRLE
jgi:hypothetical protein